MSRLKDTPSAQVHLHMFWAPPCFPTRCIIHDISHWSFWGVFPERLKPPPLHIWRPFLRKPSRLLSEREDERGRCDSIAQTETALACRLRGRVWGIRWDPFFVHYLSFEALSSRHFALAEGLNATTAPGWTFLSLTWFNVTLWLNRAVGVFLTLWYALNCSSPLRKMLFRTRWFRGRGDKGDNARGCRTT